MAYRVAMQHSLCYSEPNRGCALLKRFQLKPLKLAHAVRQTIVCDKLHLSPRLEQDYDEIKEIKFNQPLHSEVTLRLFTLRSTAASVLLSSPQSERLVYRVNLLSKHTRTI